MKYNVNIRCINGEVKLILPDISSDNLLMNLLASFDYNNFLYLFKTPFENACINFYINILSLNSFKSNERELYYKNPDTEGLYKKAIKDEFLLNKFTCINPQKQFYPLYVPILHISSLNYFNDDLVNSEAFTLPRYIKYIDSSIWNYYVPYQTDIESNKGFKHRLFIALTKIITNSLDGLYAINNAREYADLHARQAKQAYMSGVGAHTKNVSPYIFHSETDMEDLIVSKENHSNFLQNIKKCFKNGFRWRMLIVDDFANEHLITYPKGGSSLTKTDIITNILQKRFKFNKFEKEKNSVFLYSGKIENSEIQIDIVSEIKSQTTDALKDKCYDMILLDYLLKYKGPVEREYSHELLNEINDDEELQKLATPFEKFWIYHISSFRSAIQERLQEKGYNYNDKYWNIGQGACPINTPSLFEYRLYHFMDKQIKSLSLSVKIKKNEKRTIITLTDFFNIIDELSPDKMDGINELSEFIAKNFEVLLRLRGNYRVLKNELALFKNKEKEEKKNSSILINSIYKNINNYNNAFWEHLIQLMYLIAYGNIPQWMEMHEELHYLENTLPKKTTTKIRNYITQLMKIYK